MIRMSKGDFWRRIQAWKLVSFIGHSKSQAALVRAMSRTLDWSAPEVLTIWLVNLLPLVHEKRV